MCIVIVAGGEARVARGALDEADATIAGAAGELLDVLHGRAALADTGLELSGDVALARRFLGWAPLPAPA